MFIAQLLFRPQQSKLLIGSMRSGEQTESRAHRSRARAHNAEHAQVQGCISSHCGSAQIAGLPAASSWVSKSMLSPVPALHVVLPALHCDRRSLSVVGESPAVHSSKQYSNAWTAPSCSTAAGRATHEQQHSPRQAAPPPRPHLQLLGLLVHVDGQEALPHRRQPRVLLLQHKHAGPRRPARAARVRAVAATHRLCSRAGIGLAGGGCSIHSSTGHRQLFIQAERSQSPASECERHSLASAASCAALAARSVFLWPGAEQRDLAGAAAAPAAEVGPGASWAHGGLASLAVCAAPRAGLRAGLRTMAPKDFSGCGAAMEDGASDCLGAHLD